MGKHFGMDMSRYAGTFEIVGVVRDAKYNDPDQPARPMFFVPLEQRVHYPDDLMERGGGRSGSLKHRRGRAARSPQAGLHLIELLLRDAHRGNSANRRGLLKGENGTGPPERGILIR